MFGYDRVWYYGLTVFLIFIALNLLAWALRNKPRTSYAVAWLIAAYLFVDKVMVYVQAQALGEHMNFPVEFSTLSYFVYAVSVLFFGKKGSQYGVFTAILAGLVYSAASWFSPSNFAGEEGMRYIFNSAVINHHLMYLGGMLMAANCRYYPVRKCWWQLPLGVGIFVAYSWTIHTCTPYSAVMGKPLIIRITDGDILLKVFPAEKINVGYTIVYYIFAVGVLLAIMAGFYWLNYLSMKRRAKKGLPLDYYASDWRILTDVPSEWRRKSVQ